MGIVDAAAGGAQQNQISLSPGNWYKRGRADEEERYTCSNIPYNYQYYADFCLQQIGTH